MKWNKYLVFSWNQYKELNHSFLFIIFFIMSNKQEKKEKYAQSQMDKDIIEMWNKLFDWLSYLTTLPQFRKQYKYEKLLPIWNFFMYTFALFSFPLCVISFPVIGQDIKLIWGLWWVLLAIPTWIILAIFFFRRTIDIVDIKQINLLYKASHVLKNLPAWVIDRDTYVNIKDILVKLEKVNNHFSWISPYNDHSWRTVESSFAIYTWIINYKSQITQFVDIVEWRGDEVLIALEDRIKYLSSRHDKDSISNLEKMKKRYEWIKILVNKYQIQNGINTTIVNDDFNELFTLLKEQQGITDKIEWLRMRLNQEKK